MSIKNRVLKSVSFLKDKGIEKVDVGVILGSGLGSEVEEVEITLSYSDIPGFPISTVEGHKGEVLFLKRKGKRILIFSGRFHYYEGYDISEVVYPVRVLGLLGGKLLIVTNAAGGVSDRVKQGDIVLIDDHIHLIPANPLRGEAGLEFGERFVPMVNAYDKNLKEFVLEFAAKNGLSLKRGIYLSLQGPSFETLAEYKMVKILGADMVGMSTTPEVIAARQMGIKVLGFSVITNEGKPGLAERTDHKKVIEVAREKGKILLDFILELLDEIDLQ